MPRSGEDASRTARLVAGYRARATARPDGVCADAWAKDLAGEEGIELSRRMDAVFPSGELWVAVRTAFIDAEVRRLTAGEGGAGQVVILGAGLDTRAVRLAAPGVRYFEVDHPATQDDKLTRLRALRAYPLDAATYVSCDFETEDFVERLVARGYYAAAPGLFVWEGVTYYLSEDAVRATLGRIARGCHPKTWVLFDHVRSALVEGRVRDPADLATRELVRDLGEPLRFGIDDALPLLYDEGYRWVRTTSFDEACLSLTGTYDRSRKFRFQSLVLASVSRPEPP